MYCCPQSFLSAIVSLTQTAGSGEERIRSLSRVAKPSHDITRVSKTSNLMDAAPVDADGELMDCVSAVLLLRAPRTRFLATARPGPPCASFLKSYRNTAAQNKHRRQRVRASLRPLSPPAHIGPRCAAPRSLSVCAIRAFTHMHNHTKHTRPLQPLLLSSARPLA